MRSAPPLGFHWAAAGLLGLSWAAAAAAGQEAGEADACVRDACVLVQHAALQLQRQEPSPPDPGRPTLPAPAKLELGAAGEEEPSPPDPGRLTLPAPAKLELGAVGEEDEEPERQPEEPALGEELVEAAREDLEGGSDDGGEEEEGEEDGDKGGEEEEEEEEGGEEEGEDQGDEDSEGEEEEDDEEEEEGEEEEEEEESKADGAGAQMKAAAKVGAQAGEGGEKEKTLKGEGPPATPVEALRSEGGETMRESEGPAAKPAEAKAWKEERERGPKSEGPLAKAADAKEEAEEEAADTGDQNGILLFLAVGASNRSMELLARNVRHLRKAMRGARADVFLAHYDENKAAWLERDAAWYRQNIKFSVERRGYKFKLAQAALPPVLARSEPYEWVWLLDEDADFSSTDVWKMLRDAEVTRAKIVAPAMVDERSLAPQNRTAAARNGSAASLLQLQSSCSPGSLMCHHLEPHKYCHYRYVTFLEVMFPLVRQDALLKLLSDECEHCLHDRSVWGLDKIWCLYTARQFNMAQRRTCAILDRVSVVHTDHRTMEKWGSHGGRKGKVVQAYLSDEADTLKYHQEDNGFSAGSTCVLPPKKVHFRRKKQHLRCQHPRKHEHGRRRRRRRGCTSHKNSRRRRRYKVTELKMKQKAKKLKEKQLRKQNGKKLDF